ncbi:hypothetical protein M0805_006913 [Coniferiporia weirii]|nr:hypothetical protein M0805_006913 [Coniferiporia weirii]
MGDIKFQKRLSKELHIWCKLDHPHILPLLGFFFEDNDYPSLVSEWMENGTVLKYLELHPDCDLQQMILGIAKGIEYLHDNDIVHSDIKPENILISSSGRPRICDFGISHVLSASKDFNIGSSTTGGLKGTIRYTAIELFNVTDEELSTYSKASDVWAFGMTVLVLLTKEPPYSHLSNELQVIVAIMHGGLPPVPEDYEMWPGLYQSLWELCVSCWDISPFRRPTMSNICSALSSLSNHAEEPERDEEVIDHDTHTSYPSPKWVLWTH